MIRESRKRKENIPSRSVNEKPLVSIITVVLNGERYLEHTINSVLGQSYDNIEYIIIDGGSTDGTLDIIRKYDSSIEYWISRPDSGISEAFNFGIKNSSGVIIGIINSDDWYEPDAVEKVTQAFKISNSDLICGAVQFWQNNEKIIFSLSDVEKIKKETSIHHSTVFIKKNIYESFGSFDVSYKYAMDYEFLLRLKMNEVKFYSIDDVIANRRLEGISYKNRIHALRETKLARMNYFSKANVIANYIYVRIKDYLGRLLKESIFLFLYRYYWKVKNATLSKG